MWNLLAGCAGLVSIDQQAFIGLGAYGWRRSGRFRRNGRPSPTGFALAVGAGSIVVAAFIMRSRLGLALQAVSDNEVAARSLGVYVYRAKLAIYLVAAVGCAGAGAVIYLQLLRIQPTPRSGWTGRPR